MKEYIEISEKIRAVPDGLPNIAEATRQAASQTTHGVLYHQDGRYGVVWWEAWSCFTYPLPKWYDDGVTDFIDQTGRIVAIKLLHGTVCALSEGPPFLPMSPCPWCNGVVTKKDKPWEAHAFARCSSVSATYREIFLTRLPVGHR